MWLCPRCGARNVAPRCLRCQQGSVVPYLVALAVLVAVVAGVFRAIPTKPPEPDDPPPQAAPVRLALPREPENVYVRIGPNTGLPEKVRITGKGLAGQAYYLPGDVLRTNEFDEADARRLLAEHRLEPVFDNPRAFNDAR